MTTASGHDLSSYAGGDIDPGQVKLFKKRF
jgi:hypothetical protein